MTYCTHDCPTPCIWHQSIPRMRDEQDTYRDMAYEAGCILEPPKEQDDSKPSFYSPIVRRHITL